MSARAAIQAVAEKEARKHPKKKLVLEVSDNEDNNDTDNEYETLHPELEGWDNGRSNEALLRDPFKAQQEFIVFE